MAIPSVATASDIGDDFIPISALQHYLFCPRQCGLIHVERVWAENVRTAEGRVLHEKAHAGGSESRPNVRITRSLSLRSDALGVHGVADVVEFHAADDGAWHPYPVEYKRGRPKAHRADAVQLCAQAICLEEAFATAISWGALFYGETRRRSIVAFDQALRDLTADVARRARHMIAEGLTPAAVRIPGCRQCSLIEICRPDTFERASSTLAWLDRQLRA